MQSIYIDYLDRHWIKLFLIFMLFAGSLTFAHNFVLVNDDLVYQFYAEKLSYEVARELVDNQNQWGWMVYLLLPVFYLGKFLLVTCALMAGIFFAEYNRAEFMKVFKMIIVSEFLLLVPMIVKLLWFGVFHLDYTLIEIQYFSPLSVGSLLDTQTVPQWIMPFTSALNLFELAYWLILAAGLSIVAEKPFWGALQLVVLSYGSAWLLFQVFIMFFLINIT